MLTAKCTNPDTDQKAAIFHLWNNEYPSQLGFQTFADLEQYLANLINPAHYFVTYEGRTIGWAFAFERDNERWFAIIVDRSMHKKQIGSQLLHTLKENEPILNGWATDHDRYTKKDGTPYAPPVNFYVKNGFSICSDVRLEIEKLSAVKIRWVRDTVE